MLHGVPRERDPTGQRPRSALRELPESVLAIRGHALRGGGRGSAEGHREMKDDRGSRPGRCGACARVSRGASNFGPKLLRELLKSLAKRAVPEYPWSVLIRN